MKLNNEEKRAKIAQVDQLNAKGTPIKDACKTAGMHYSSYYSWKKLLADKPVKARLKAKPTPKLLHLPAMPAMGNSHVVLLVVPASQLKMTIEALQ